MNAERSSKRVNRTNEVAPMVFAILLYITVIAISTWDARLAQIRKKMVGVNEMASRDRVWGAFQEMAVGAGVDLASHKEYDRSYVMRRVALYCQLLAKKDTQALTDEITFPPTQATPGHERQHAILEGAILFQASLYTCPQYRMAAQKWIYTFGS